jgi:hypothetical protein
MFVSDGGGVVVSIPDGGGDVKQPTTIKNERVCSF